MSEFRKFLKKALSGQLDEVSPPGFKGTVKVMKKHDDVDNPFALGWWMKNKGYKSHKKASGADKNETVGESMDDMFKAMKDAAEYNIKFGLNPDDVEKQADEAESKFPASAAGIRAVARLMRDMLQKNERLGGGHTTDVPLTDARGGSGMGAQGEGEIAIQAYNSADHQLVQDNLDDEEWEIDPHSGEEVPKNREPGKYYGPDERFQEETGDNWSQTSGTGTPHSPWVATDAMPEIPPQYDMDQGKLPESFDFSLGEDNNTLAASKGIKRVKQNSDQGGKGAKFISEPEGNKRPDYKTLGAKDVNTADNLSDEAISDEMKNSAYETIRIDHVTKGKGTVLEIGENYIKVDWDRSSLRILGPERLPLSETKYLTRIKERYSDDPDDADVDIEKTEPKDKKKMVKKKVDEAWISAIKSTMRNTSSDGYNLPVINLNPEDIGLINELNVPDPGDSVLTGQDSSGTPSIEPLSTERGAEAAHDDIYPDGDFANDLVPPDAPGTPSYDQLGDDAGNPRNTDGSDNPSADLGSNSAGKSSDVKPEKTEKDGSGPEKKGTNDTRSADDSDDYKKPKKGENPFAKKDSDNSDDSDDSDDDEDKDMKEGLTWKDIGLDITEMAGGMSDHDMAYEDETCEGCGDMHETHDTGGGEVGMTPGLLKKLLSAIRDQSPDDSKMEMICGGLEEASREKGATLDENDVGMIMDKFKTAAEGGGVEADPSMGDDYDEGGEDPNSIGGPDAYEAEGDDEDNEAGDVRRRGHGSDYDDDSGVRDDEYGDDAEDNDKKEYEDRAEGDGDVAGPEGGEEHEGKKKLMDKKGREGDPERKRDQERKDARRAKQARRYGESKGNIKPITTNKSKGKGPGGGNATNDGQDPLIPAMDKGNQRGTPGTPLSKEGGGRTVKPVSESMVAVGMAGIGGTVRNIETVREDEGLTDEQKELQMIRRRAGLEDWWKV